MTYAKWAHERKAEEAEKALKRNPSEYWAGVELSDEPWPEIEYEESYPADEDFKDFDGLPLSFAHAGEWLARELPRAALNMPCGCWLEDGKTITGKPTALVHFSTYGWSGAESLIGLIESRIDTAHLMLSWQRGGHYVFELPIKEATNAA